MPTWRTYPPLLPAEASRHVLASTAFFASTLWAEEPGWNKLASAPIHYSCLWRFDARSKDEIRVLLKPFQYHFISMVTMRMTGVVLYETFCFEYLENRASRIERLFSDKNDFLFSKKQGFAIYLHSRVLKKRVREIDGTVA